MKKLSLSLVAAALAVGGLVAASSIGAQAQQKFITIGTGGVTGV
ncbi:MAG: C4-dicarboxylate ABC transporter substrate-binding protein, partial [Proteobacteria bacterium]|nr:C4-dicarboxylate ABC transporter substrate-binding protein [Pseudomonadota bacterium]